MEQDAFWLGFRQYFQSNYSFEIQEACKAVGININQACVIHFFDNETVSQYGNDTKLGMFEAQPNIAGIGIWWGMAPGMVVCVLAMLFFGREARWFHNDRQRKKVPDHLLPLAETPKHSLLARRHQRTEAIARFYRIIRALVVSAADSQTIVALSYGINFGMLGKCSLSAYHYNVGINTILCTCTAITFSVIMVRDYWKGAAAPALRFIISIGMFATLGRMLWYQMERSIAPEPIGWLPHWTTVKGNSTDSTIFVPMACFLDPDLNPLRRLSPAEKKRVGGDKAPIPVEFCLFWLIVIWFITGHISHFIQRETRYGKQSQNVTNHIPVGGLAVFYYALSLGSCISVYFSCWGHISEIRKFVHSSGWIEGGNTGANPENNVNGIGQLIPLIAIGWVFITFLDQIPK